VKRMKTMLDREFTCLFCHHEACISVKMYVYHVQHYY
jgi:transcription elongation factor Elf1